MKNQIIFCIFLLPQLLFSQSNISQKIYVWPFSDANGKFAIEASQLTNEVEEALTQTGTCTVLQRRDFARLLSHIENESEIQSVEGMSKSTNQELETIKAETVLFGSVEKDFSGTIRLQVSFQNLSSKQILLQNSIFLTGEDALDMFKRKEKVRQFITACVNPSAFNEERDWGDVNNIGTKEAFVAYLEKYPSGLYASSAKRAINDETFWSEILNETKDNKQIKLLEDYRDAKFERHEDDANAALEELLYRNKKYDKYLGLFPDGQYAVEAQKKMDENNQRNAGILGKVAEVAGDVLNENQNTPEEPNPPPAQSNQENIEQNGLQKGTYHILQKSTGRFMDAHEKSSDYALVTRTFQNNSSQEWILTPLGNDTYTIQQKSTGRYADAHEASKDYALVTRTWQGNASQQWVLTPLGNNTYTIQQKSTGRYVDAHETSKDYGLVTRTWQGNATQQWVIKRL